MDKKVALITGASRGLGKVLAEELVSAGYFVYAGVRDLIKAPESTSSILLDMACEEDLQNCVKTIIEEKGKIDLLIHNAAEAYWGAADSLTLAEARQLFEVNVMGPFRLTQLVLPYMRDKRSGRITFISSIRAVESCAFMGMYSGSKAALEAIAFDWAATCHQWNLLVSVVEPGPLDTNIVLKHGSYFPSEKDNPYLPYGDVSLTVQPVNKAAEAIIEHLQDPNPPFRFQTNLFSKEVALKHLKDSTGRQWCEEQRTWVNNSVLEAHGN